jgi:hypothetical protein
MIASSHPEHITPAEEASINQQDYAEELAIRIFPEQARHPPLAANSA